MAMVKCPECGRENVSDKAEACPDCGYGLKAHFENIRREEQKRKVYENRVRNVPMPAEPEFHISAVLCYTAIGLLGFVFGVGFGVGFTIFAFIVGYCTASDIYERNMKDYQLAKSNFEQYQRTVISREDNKAAIEAAKPKCPH